MSIRIRIRRFAYFGCEFELTCASLCVVCVSLSLSLSPSFYMSSLYFNILFLFLSLLISHTLWAIVIDLVWPVDWGLAPSSPRSPLPASFQCSPIVLGLCLWHKYSLLHVYETLYTFIYIYVYSLLYGCLIYHVIAAQLDKKSAGFCIQPVCALSAFPQPLSRTQNYLLAGLSIPISSASSSAIQICPFILPPPPPPSSSKSPSPHRRPCQCHLPLTF